MNTVTLNMNIIQGSPGGIRYSSFGCVQEYVNAYSACRGEGQLVQVSMNTATIHYFTELLSPIP